MRTSQTFRTAHRALPCDVTAPQDPTWPPVHFSAVPVTSTLKDSGLWVTQSSVVFSKHRPAAPLVYVEMPGENHPVSLHWSENTASFTLRKETASSWGWQGHFIIVLPGWCCDRSGFQCVCWCRCRWWTWGSVCWRRPGKVKMTRSETWWPTELRSPPTGWVPHTHTPETHTHRVSRVRVVLVTCLVTRQSHDAVAEPDVMESLKSGS